MHILRLISVFVIVILLFGCSQQGSSQKEEQDISTVESAKVTQDIIEQKDKQIEELADQVEQIKSENNGLKDKIDGLEEEKQQFLIADRFGRKLYQAMVFGDIENLKHLTATSNLQVFDNRFELQVDEELVQIPFSGLQTEAHLNNQVILKTNGFGFDDDKQVMRIHYTIIEPKKSGISSEYFLNLNLVKVGTLEWSIDNVEFDI